MSIYECVKDWIAEATKPPTIADIIRFGRIECGNCGTYRRVNSSGEVSQCPYCDDDEWDLYDAADQIVP